MFVATFEEHWAAPVEALIAQLGALHKLVETVDARLIVMKIPLRRQTMRPHTAPQGVHGNAHIRKPVDPHASVISSNDVDPSPVTASYVTGSKALLVVTTYIPSTDLLHNTLHQPPMPLLTPQLPRVPPQFLTTALSRVTGRQVSLYPHRYPISHANPTSATAVPSQPQFLPFRSPYHPLHPPFTSVENHIYAHTAPRSAVGTLGSHFSGLEPVHELVPMFAEVVDYRL